MTKRCLPQALSIWCLAALAGSAYAATVADDPALDGAGATLNAGALNSNEWLDSTAVATNAVDETTDFAPYDWLSDTEADAVSSIHAPIPAAAWMFASAIGLLGWLRTRSRSGFGKHDPRTTQDATPPTQADPVHEPGSARAASAASRSQSAHKLTETPPPAVTH